MEPFRVHILGCGSALPTPRHYASAQVVEVRGKLFLVDCAEGTQVQLRRSHIRFTKISAVFISHLHGDHCFGLIGMLSTFGLLGRTARLAIYAPGELEDMLRQQMRMFCHDFDYEVDFHAVDTRQQQVIYDDRSLTVETIPLEHRMPCCGYLFREKNLLPHIRRDMIDMYEIPISQINNIKAGMDWTLPDGTIVPNENLVTSPTPPRSFAYCSDTTPLPSLVPMIKDVDLLFHEATFDQENEFRARQTYHSTTLEAAGIAKEAHVGQLCIGHYSSRMRDEEKMLREARSIFPNTVLADEGKSIIITPATTL